MTGYTLQDSDEMSSELIRTHQVADERWPLTIAYTLQDSDEGSSGLIRPLMRTGYWLTLTTSWAAADY